MRYRTLCARYSLRIKIPDSMLFRAENPGFFIAEMKGFEPLRRLPDLPHFECGPFNHLGTSPKYQRYKKTGEYTHRLYSFAAGDRGRTGMRF